MTALACEVAPTRPMDLEVRLADEPGLVDQIFALRYRVFYQEMGARGDFATRLRRRDVDKFDGDCEHLAVIDHAAPDGAKIVGAYRLRRAPAADRGFYSLGEFEIAPLAAFGGDALELGRSCVDPDYRCAPTLQLLWRGLTAYLDRHPVSVMFGCASFEGVRPEDHADSLAFLARRFLADPALRPYAHPERAVALDPDPTRPIDEKRARAALPTLIKSYLRAGGRIGEGAVIDFDFNTVDVCMFMPTTLVQARYRRHFGGALRVVAS